MKSLQKAVLFAAVCMLTACGDSTATLMERLAAMDVDTIDAASALNAKAVQAGEQLYGQHCAQCHGGGDKPRIAQAPDLQDDYWLIGGEDLETFKIRASDLENRIRFGIRAAHDATWKEAVMPQRGSAGDLTPLEIDQVAEFVLERSGFKDVDLDIAMQGEAVYAGKGGCYDCHGPKGEGSSAIGATDLTRPQHWLYGTDRQSVTAVITNGTAGVSPAFEGQLAPGEIKAIALYLRSSAKGLGF